MGTEIQLLNRPMRCGPKDPERNVALDRNEAILAGAAKRQKRLEMVRELPKPLGKVTEAGGSTGLQEGWASRPTIADESGTPMDRGGEEAIREMNRQANELLVEQLTLFFASCSNPGAGALVRLAQPK